MASSYRWGENAAAIPKGLNNDYFSELHPYVNAGKSPRGAKVSGALGSTLSIVGTVSMFTGIFTGDPDAWINGFHSKENPEVGDLIKDWDANLYVGVTSVVDHYIPVLNAKGNQIIDEKTGKPKYRLGSKTVTANVYMGYIWNEDTHKFEGVDAIEKRTEIWQYDEKGERKKQVIDPKTQG